MNGDSDSPGASWTRHNKVRARLEKDGALEVQVEGLTTQAKYYKPLLKDFFRLHFPVRPRWGDWSAHIVMEFTGDPPTWTSTTLPRPCSTAPAVPPSMTTARSPACWSSVA